MPTISELPALDQVTASDQIPVSQAGATRSVSVGTLLASMQPAVISDTGTLLGRLSLGPGGPESVAIGAGLLLNDGTLAATGSISGQGGSYSITGLAPVTGIAAGDMVGISHDGVDHAISYGNLLDGLTIDLAQPAVAVTDTDALWVAQGTNTMLRQSFAAVWSWLLGKLPSYRLPVIEITHDTTLDATVHNGRILVCSQPVTLTPVLLNLGNGFFCDIINLSSANVVFGAGILASSGSSLLPAGQAAALRAVNYSGGSVLFALVSGTGGGTGAPSLPGQVTGLSATSPSSSSIGLTWSAPASGGGVSSYTVQYRVSGGSTWTTFISGLSTTNTTVTALTAGTGYDFQVIALNGAGSGQPSATASASTLAPPGAVVSIAWNMVPSGSYTHGAGSIGVNAHINPGTAAVQFGFSTSATIPPASWTVANYVNTDLWGAYVSTPASAGTWYAWVEGTDGSNPTVYPAGFTVT